MEDVHIDNISLEQNLERIKRLEDEFKEMNKQMEERLNKN